MTSTPEYPPEPWHLVADAFVSMWTVPVAELPRVPDAVAPVSVGGHALVFTAWFDYRPEGQMSYHELLAAVAVRHGLRPAGTITEIWVDSPASQAGGRTLWGIPKEITDFTFTYGRGFTASAGAGDDWIATAAFSPRPGLPVPLPAGFAISQEVAGRPKVSDVRAAGKPCLAPAAWNINPLGRLGYLAGRTPCVSAHLSDVRIRFGA